MADSRLYASLVVPANVPKAPTDHHHAVELRNQNADEAWMAAIIHIHSYLEPLSLVHLSEYLFSPVVPGDWSRWDFVGFSMSYDAREKVAQLPIVDVLFPSVGSPKPLTTEHINVLGHLTSKGLKVGDLTWDMAKLLAQHHKHPMYDPET